MQNHIRKLVFVFLFLCAPAYAQPQPGSVKSITEEDGSPDVYPWQIKFSNGGVTDNGDGTASISTGGGSVTSVTASTPLSSSGGTTPNISIQNYTGTNNVVLNNAPSITSPTITTSINLPSSAVDALTEISATLKSGADATLITGTEGTSGTCAEWNADGDLVEAASAAACGSGGSGDNVSVNGTAATNANFVDGELLFSINTVPTIDEISATLDTGLLSSRYTAIFGDETGTKQLVFNDSPTITSPTVATSISQDGDVADAGYFRLQNAAQIAWEASPAGTDLTLAVDSSEILTSSAALTAPTITATNPIGIAYGGTGETTVGTGKIFIGSSPIDGSYQNIAGRSLTTGSNIIDADVELYTAPHGYRLPNPIASDDDKSIWLNDTANGFTVTKLWCESDQTVTLMLQVDDGTPADMDTVDLVCISTPDTDTSLDGDATIAVGDRVDLAITSVASSPTWVSIFFTGTWDD